MIKVDAGDSVNVVIEGVVVVAEESVSRRLFISSRSTVSLLASLVQ